MLLAVEGGGFFSSSASGYSDGLALLLLGRAKEDRPMRVSPWSRYQLVGQGVDPDVQLDSKKSRLFRKCAFFICFGRASSRLEGQRSSEVGPASGKGKVGWVVSEADDEGGEGQRRRRRRLKSSLKKQVDFGEGGGGEVSAAGGVDLRRVHWRDASGRDLADVREFEASEEEPSDEEVESDGIRGCECVIQ